jgi:peptidoglycan/xylan/chitin deacetylase (PgdA/CDA1 family)
MGIARRPTGHLPIGLALALTFATIAAATPAHGADASISVPVLMYHRISAPPPVAVLPHLWVAPERFRRQLAALRRHGWRTITAEVLGRAVRDRRAVGRKRFVITIDDGARDGWSNAAPILADLRMHATYCVVPGRAHKPWQLDFRRMRQLRAAGHEIANHSLSHADLPSLPLAELRHQVRKAHRLIAERVGRAPRTFCYPYGHHDAAVRRVVAASGSLLAFTTVHGGTHSAARAMRSPRVRVNGGDSPRALLARMAPYASGR